MIKICHCADIHLRTFQRHEEYLKHFDNFFNSLKQYNPDYVVIVGDLLHQKTSLSPEMVKICSNFLKHLAHNVSDSIRKVIVSPGNHDGLILNTSRMDSLSPIINDAIHDDRIVYLKKSQIYKVDDGIQFVNFSCFDSQDLWPKKSDIDKKCVNIGLYHGLINDSMFDNNIRVDNGINLKFFLDKVDYLFLGDIHKSQILDENYRVVYPGSFIQQNYGESIEKGYFLWQIENKEKHVLEFIKLPNICPFYTLELKNDLKVSDSLEYQKQARIRIISKQLNVTEKKDIEDKIKLFYDPYEIIFMDDINGERQDIKIDSCNSKIENLVHRDVQETLIKDFLLPYNISKECFIKILELNKKYELEARKDEEVIRNILYRFDKLKFSNICSYGENNEFNFSDYKGILGVFGKNGTGKSSLVVDIPNYCLFNKISKDGVVKNDLLINEKKDSCFVEMDLTSDDKVYNINRITSVYTKAGKRKGTPTIQGKTDVKFTITHKDGRQENKNEEERSETDKEIRKIFGTSEDFLLTSVAPQFELLNFIKKGSTERQKIIGKYFDIDIFQKKHDLANEYKKEIRLKLKLYEDINFDKDIESKKQLLAQCLQTQMTYNLELQKLEKDKQDAQKQIVELKNNIVNISDIQGSEDGIKTDLFLLQESLKILEHKLEDVNFKLQKNNIVIDEYRVLSSSNDCVDNLKQEIIQCQDLINKIIDATKEISQLQQHINKNNEKINRLLNAKCINNSNCCLKVELDECLKYKQDLENKLNQNNIIIGNHKKEILQEQLEELKLKLLEDEKMKKDIEKINFNSSYLQKDISNLEKEKELLNIKILSKQKMLEDIIKNKEQIIKNKELQILIDSLNDSLENVSDKVRSLQTVLINLAKEIGTYESSLESILKEKNKYLLVKEEYEVYEYFLKCMSKDGIPQKIISNNLGIINKEIKKILRNNVNFNVLLESEEKELEIYFKSEKGKKRKIELCSGMEKTLAALAIRVALCNITTLPKSNIFVLDEIFTSLDKEYLEVVGNILEYLKKIFELVIVVTHLDEIKDFVDNMIVIERDEKGFSNIRI